MSRRAVPRSRVRMSLLTMAQSYIFIAVVLAAVFAMCSVVSVHAGGIGKVSEEKFNAATMRCSACYAVAKELRRKLQQEKKGHDIQVGEGRLHDKNKRKIAYETSEVRMIEVFETLCENMEDYAVMESDTEGHKWVKTQNNDGPLNISGTLKMGRESKEQKKQLKFMCNKMVEDHEEVLVESIIDRILERDENVFDNLLCEELTEHCSYSKEVTAIWNKQQAKLKKLESKTKAKEASEANKDEL